MSASAVFWRPRCNGVVGTCGGSGQASVSGRPCRGRAVGVAARRRCRRDDDELRRSCCCSTDLPWPGQPSRWSSLAVLERRYRDIMSGCDEWHRPLFDRSPRLPQLHLQAGNSSSERRMVAHWPRLKRRIDEEYCEASPGRAAAVARSRRSRRDAVSSSRANGMEESNSAKRLS